MKIEKLNTEYLEGLVDMAIANFHEHTSIPAELGVMYDVNIISEAMAKITFSWKVGEEREEETNFGEDKVDTDYFTIIRGERVIKLQLYVDEILDRLTA